MALLSNNMRIVLSAILLLMGAGALIMRGVHLDWGTVTYVFWIAIALIVGGGAILEKAKRKHNVQTDDSKVI